MVSHNQLRFELTIVQTFEAEVVTILSWRRSRTQLTTVTVHDDVCEAEARTCHHFSPATASRRLAATIRWAGQRVFICR
ncbi:hypothetical protein E2C01_013221 [Portunus trituberculatus]|uniref:Uncharacterized protein n=1 Tax=Portunus trituberculatus TaxID=210409 RepID=A0A5B7DGP9_PORTR|nr:hypothetical protein [Portunus trituberculatus]